MWRARWGRWGGGPVVAACALTLVVGVSVFPAATAGGSVSDGRAVAVCFGRTATITGTGAGETLFGTTGADVMVGLGGDDIIYGLGGNDRVCGGSGNDTIIGGGGRDKLNGGVDDDVVGGGPGDDKLLGSGGDDILRGGDGDDTLVGNGGNDALEGEAGTDATAGGPGTDTCRGETKSTCELPAPPAEGATHYVSPAGADTNPGTIGSPWRTIQHAADELEAGETVYIRAGTYTERVQARRSGTAEHYIEFVAYPGEAPVIDGAGVTLPPDQAGLFEINGFSHIRVSGLRVVNARPDDNSNGIFVYGAHGVRLEDNETYNTKSSGIGVWNSSDVIVSGNEIVHACTGGYQESLTVAGTDTFEVVANIVRDTAGGKEGIDAKDGSRNGKIHGNLVYNVPAVGIYIDAWDKLTSGISVYQNTIHDTGNGIAVASEMGGTLVNIQIYNPLVYRNEYIGIAITRNGLGSHHPIQGVTIVNNTVWRNGATWGGGIAVDNPHATGVVVRNNILSANLSFQLSLSADVPAANATIDHQLIHGYQGNLEDGEIYGSDYVEGNPRFANASGGDFHLRAGSPAGNVGSPAGAPPRDFDDVPRPQGAGHDIGAFER